jgi:hypothetical protein
MDNLDKISLLYVAFFSFLYRWEDLYFFKLLSLITIFCLAANEIFFSSLRYTFSIIFHSKKSELFQITFKEQFDYIEKIIEGSIRRSFFRSKSYQLYINSMKEDKNFLRKITKVIKSVTANLILIFVNNLIFNFG